MFYTSMALYNTTTGDGGDGGHGQDGNNVVSESYDPWIIQSGGRIYADENGMWLTGFRT